MELSSATPDTWSCEPEVASPAAAAPSPRTDRPIDRIVYIRQFDSASDHDWCELIRDVVALANSGGGTITIACPSDAISSDPACPRASDLTTSDVLHRLARYTDGSFADLRVRKTAYAEGPAVEILVGPAAIPIGFTQTADCAGAKDEPPLFSAGTFYFRHGGVSEPGSSRDIRAAVDRRLRHVRKRWLREIRRAMSLPGERRRPFARRAGKHVEPLPVRIVTDPDAPALQPQDVERLFPWRQKDLVRELNARLRGRVVNSYDIQAVRRQHRLDERPDFVFHLEGAGRRYSPAAAEWMLAQYAVDPAFFERARADDRQMLKLRRQMPR